MAGKQAVGKEAGKEMQAEPAVDAAGKKKKLILAAAGGALVVVLGILLGVVLLGGKSDGEDGKAAAEEVHAQPALYVSLGPKFQVTLPGEGKPHYLQVTISVLTREQAVVDELNFNAPLLRDRVDSLLARQEFEKLRTEQGKLVLRDELLKTVRVIVDEALGQGQSSAAKGEDGEEDAGDKPKKARTAQGEQPHAARVEQIFFTEFVLQ